MFAFHHHNLSPFDMTAIYNEELYLEPLLGHWKELLLRPLLFL